MKEPYTQILLTRSKMGPRSSSRCQNDDKVSINNLPTGFGVGPHLREMAFGKKSKTSFFELTIYFGATPLKFILQVNYFPKYTPSPLYTWYNRITIKHPLYQLRTYVGPVRVALGAEVCGGGHGSL